MTRMCIHRVDIVMLFAMIIIVSLQKQFALLGDVRMRLIKSLQMTRQETVNYLQNEILTDKGDQQHGWLRQINAWSEKTLSVEDNFVINRIIQNLTNQLKVLAHFKFKIYPIYCFIIAFHIKAGMCITSYICPSLKLRNFERLNLMKQNLVHFKLLALSFTFAMC